MKPNSNEEGNSLDDIINYLDALPKAVSYYTSFFPNNYLSLNDLDDKDYILNAKKEFQSLLDSNAEENEILTYIKKTGHYFIIGSIFHCGPKICFNFGHHEAFLFREFPLGTDYRADYLLVGKNSGGYEYIFIELESPKVVCTIKNGEFGESIRKGIAQVKDWQRWLMSNFSLLYPEFEKHLGQYKNNLPKEFHKLDRTRLHFVVVAGRRTHYNEKTYSLKRELFNDSNIMLLHYDNVIDLIDYLIAAGNY